MDKAAEDTLDALDRWSDRPQHHCTQKRKSKRNSFRHTISLFVCNSAKGAREVGEREMTEAYARDLSASGVGFIHPQNLPTDKITVCLSFKNNKCIYVNGKIVRRRKVHNDFWEYGVQFTDRADPSS